MNESSRPAIGVVEAPDLAHALTLLGFFVVGGGDFRASALAIRSNPEAEKAPVVVFDATKPGLRAWVDKQIQTGSRVVVLRGAGSGSIPQDSGVNIQLPVAVNDVLAQAGWGPSPHPLGQATVTADGLVPDLALYAEAERAVEPEPESVVEPEPAAAQPVFIEPTAVQLQFDVPKTQAVSAPLPDWTQEGFGSTTVEPTPDAPAVNAAVPDWVNGEFTPSAPSRVQPVFNEPQPPAQAFLPPIAAESDEPKYAPLPDWMTGALPPAAETERPVSVPAPEQSSPVAPQHTQLVQAPEDDMDFDAMVARASGASIQNFSQQPPAETPRFDSAPPAYQPPAPQQPDYSQVPPAYQPPVQPQQPPAYQQPPQEQSAYQQPDFNQVPPAYQPPAQQPPAYDPFAQQPQQVAPQQSYNPFGDQQRQQPPAQAFPQPTATPPYVNPADQGPATFGTEQFSADYSAPAFVAAGGASAFGSGNAAKVIISFAGKGGVGKTSCALAMAQRASEAGLRAAVVDMNRGQGDVRTFLRLANPNLPSIYNASISGLMEDAVLSPQQINDSRRPDLPKLGFALVLAPPPELADPRVVTADIYRKIIEFLKIKVDLVIVDTQIAEAHDTTGLIENLVIPSLIDGAWGLGVTDMSSAGLNNLLGRVKKFSTHGVDRKQMLLAVNKAASFDTKDQDTVKELFGAYATFAGAAGADLDFANQLNIGVVDVDGTALRPLIDHVLLTVTGNGAFTPQPQRRRGLFGRKK